MTTLNEEIAWGFLASICLDALQCVDAEAPPLKGSLCCLCGYEFRSKSDECCRFLRGSYLRIEAFLGLRA